jgi:hypothetical protein
LTPVFRSEAAIMSEDIDNVFPGAGRVPGKQGF